MLLTHLENPSHDQALEDRLQKLAEEAKDVPLDVPRDKVRLADVFPEVDADLELRASQLEAKAVQEQSHAELVGKAFVDEFEPKLAEQVYSLMTLGEPGQKTLSEDAKIDLEKRKHAAIFTAMIPLVTGLGVSIAAAGGNQLGPIYSVPMTVMAVGAGLLGAWASKSMFKSIAISSYERLVNKYGKKSAGDQS